MGSILTLVIIHLCYFAYLELNPKLGKIIFRPNENNDLIFSWSSLVHFITTPINYRNPQNMTLFWKLENLDLNYIVMVGVPFISITILKNLINWF